jgi:putative transposase
VPHRLIDQGKLLQFLNTNTHKTLAKTHRRWVENQLKNAPERQEHFSASIAVGSQAYIQKVRQALGIKGIGRRMAEAAAVAGYQLKESVAKYGSADLNQAESHQSASPVVNTIPWKW